MLSMTCHIETASGRVIDRDGRYVASKFAYHCLNVNVSRDDFYVLLLDGGVEEHDLDSLSDTHADLGRQRGLLRRLRELW